MFEIPYGYVCIDLYYAVIATNEMIFHIIKVIIFGSVGKFKDPYIFPFVSVCLSSHIIPPHGHSFKPISMKLGVL